MTDNGLTIGQLRRDSAGVLRIGRHAPNLPHHRILWDARTGRRYGVLFSDEYLTTLPIVADDNDVCACGHGAISHGSRGCVDCICVDYPTDTDY